MQTMLVSGKVARTLRIALLALCIPTALASSYSFTGTYGTASTSSDCAGLNTFREALTGTETSITISSSNGNSVTCDDASVAPSIAAAYKAGSWSEASFTCDGLECECRAIRSRFLLA